MQQQSEKENQRRLQKEADAEANRLVCVCDFHELIHMFMSYNTLIIKKEADAKIDGLIIVCYDFLSRSHISKICHICTHVSKEADAKANYMVFVFTTSFHELIFRRFITYIRMFPMKLRPTAWCSCMHDCLARTHIHQSCHTHYTCFKRICS